jgi:hypothetical protein
MTDSKAPATSFGATRSLLILDEPPRGGERESMPGPRSWERIDHISGRKERLCPAETDDDGWSAARLPDPQIDARVPHLHGCGENTFRTAR